MLELLNQDEIRRVVETGESREGNADLLADLCERYPDHPFELVAVRYDRRCEGGLVDAKGRRHAESYKDWMQAEFDAAGGNARAVWVRYKDADLITTEWCGQTLYFTIPFGPEPEDFFQLEVTVRMEFMCKPAFGIVAPKSLSGLLDPLFTADIQKLMVTHPQYSFKRLTNIRQFVREMETAEMAQRNRKLPEMENKMVLDIHAVPGRTAPVLEKIPFLQKFPSWLTRPMRERRFLHDWRDSSAGGSGLPLCRHWFLQLEDDRGSEGLQGFIPQWADIDGGMSLPKIAADEHGSVYSLMEELEDLDCRAGYPFAWFFYMVHRNRLDGDVGEMVAQGVKEGKVRLRASDEAVLLRWFEDQYGF